MPTDDATAAADPTPLDAPAARHERRRRSRDRRQSVFYALWHGVWRPRRRAGRRVDDRERPIVDWREPSLLASALMILLLCVLDSFLTLKLLAAGSREENPVMALFVYGDTLHFVLAKLALTGAGLLVLVACARFRVFRLLRVDAIVHTVLAGYVMVIAYELTLAANLS